MPSSLVCTVAFKRGRVSGLGPREDLASRTQKLGPDTTQGYFFGTPRKAVRDLLFGSSPSPGIREEPHQSRDKREVSLDGWQAAAKVKLHML